MNIAKTTVDTTFDQQPKLGGLSWLRLEYHQRLGPIIRWIGVWLYIGGLGVLGQAYQIGNDGPSAYIGFWIGLGLCYLATVAFGTSVGARPFHQVMALAMLGAALYLPIYLRSPQQSIFQDELYHIQILEFMRDLGTTRVPVTLFRVPGDYPGLQFVGLAVLYTTGLPIESTARLVILAIHVAIPLVAYYALRSCGLQPNVAFLGALFFIMNRSYFFFHSIFSYETLGIVLFLLVALLAIRYTNITTESRLPTSLLLFGVITAVVATHHMSGLLTIGLLLSFTLTSMIVRGRAVPNLGGATLYAIVFWCFWLVYQTIWSMTYVSYTLIDKAITFANTFTGLFADDGKETELRTLFEGSPLPLVEQLFAYAYPLIVLVLVFCGLIPVWKRLRTQHTTGDRVPVAWIALGVFGPIFWLFSWPAIFTTSSDAAFRSWAFLFLGLSLYATIGIHEGLKVFGRAQFPVAYLVIGFLLVGSIVLGDNQAGRFRTLEPHAVAGPGAQTTDLISAARWLERTAGRFHTVAGDKSSQVAFAVFGKQRTRIWGVWEIFYTPSTNRARQLLIENKVDYVVVDNRVTRYPSRYQDYYGPGDKFDTLVPPQRLDKFKTMSRVQRIYDNGDIVVYSHRMPKAN